MARGLRGERRLGAAGLFELKFQVSPDRVVCREFKAIAWQRGELQASNAFIHVFIFGNEMGRNSLIRPGKLHGIDHAALRYTNYTKKLAALLAPEDAGRAAVAGAAPPFVTDGVDGHPARGAAPERLDPVPQADQRLSVGFVQRANRAHAARVLDVPVEKLQADRRDGRRIGRRDGKLGGHEGVVVLELRVPEKDSSGAAWKKKRTNKDGLLKE